MPTFYIMIFTIEIRNKFMAQYSAFID